MKKIETYQDFCRAFDEMEKCNLMDSNKRNPAIRLSDFRKENPAKYDEYREQMHREHVKSHCAGYNDQDNSNNEGLLKAFQSLPI